MEKESYIGVVEKIITDGPHGPYALVTKVEPLGSVTFSLRPPVWNEDDLPEPGMYVVLEKVRRKRAGWRANSGRFLKPSDQQPIAVQKKGAKSNER